MAGSDSEPMTKEEFARLCAGVFDGAWRGVVASLERPAGRRPPPATAAAAEWYATLSADERAKCAQVARFGAHAGAFGMLALMDHVRSTGRREGRFELSWVAADGSRSVLNDERGEMLHDLFQSEVYDIVFGTQTD